MESPPIPCPRCGASGAARLCARCGRGLIPKPQPLVAAVDPAARPPPRGPFRVGPVRAGGGLALNAIVWPGLGSLVVGEQVGWAQGILFLAGLFLVVMGLGLLPMLAAWVWALVTSGRVLLRAAEGRAVITA